MPPIRSRSPEGKALFLSACLLRLAGAQQKRKAPDESSEDDEASPKRATGGGLKYEWPQKSATSPAYGGQRSAVLQQHNSGIIAAQQRTGISGGGHSGSGGGSGYGRGGGGYSRGGGGYGSGGFSRYQNPGQRGIYRITQPAPQFGRQAAAARGRPLGMTNLGNTCYMNATLQV